MAEEPGKHSDRYDVTGNIEAEYYDEQQTVLVNKLGMRDLEQLLIVEERALARAYEQLFREVQTDTPLSNDLIQRIHKTIFGGIYAWAGRWRTVTISKPGITWPPPAFLEQTMEAFEQQVLRKHRAHQLEHEESFCRAAAEIQGEFLVVHPFREGNARTIKLLTDLIAAQTGRTFLVYDQSEEGRKAYILAAGQAFRKNYAPLEKLIRDALGRAAPP